MRSMFVLAALAGCGGSALAQPVLYVDDSAPAGGDGASWATAFDTLQAALSAARAPGSGTLEIRVAQGVYRPDRGPGQTPGDRLASFELVPGVALRGGYAGFGAQDPDDRRPKTFVSVLSGDLLGNDGADFANYGDNSYNVVRATSVGSGMLEGFTIRAGNAFPSSPHNEGGGLLSDNSTFTIANCVFTANRANFGGGINASAGQLFITSCVFEDNAAASWGGGILLEGSHSRVSLCEFVGNYAGDWGAGVMSLGSDVNVSSSTFRDNTANFGGGVYAFGGQPRYVSCLFLGNTASNSGGGASMQGSGVRSFANCVFSGNIAAGVGGAISGPGALVQNSTFSLNVAGDVGGGLAGIGATVHNSIFWGNSDSRGAQQLSQIEPIAGTPSVSWSIVQGYDGTVFMGGGNTADNPMFVDAVGPDDTPGTPDDDLRVAQGSPAIDSGSNGLVPTDATDLDQDGNSGEPLPYDVAGGPRFVDDPSAPDTGFGTPPLVDRGAYESPGFNAPSCPADLTGDGLVNAQDLSQLLGLWGSGPGPADITGDGLVNAQDLSQMLGVWGPCGR